MLLFHHFKVTASLSDIIQKISANMSEKYLEVSEGHLYKQYKTHKCPGTARQPEIQTPKRGLQLNILQV